MEENTMTRKRYQKLGRALITRIVQQSCKNGDPMIKKAISSIRRFENLKLIGGKWSDGSKAGAPSYQEMWDSMKSVREMYGME